MTIERPSIPPAPRFLGRRLGARAWGALSAAAFAGLLAGCGGSSDSGTGGIAISGTAATGAAVVNASVTVKCVDGAPISTTTGSGGAWFVTAAGSLPCAAELDTGKRKYHSVLTGSGSTANSTLNVTPLTEQIVAQIAPDTSAMFQSFGADAATTFTPAAVGKAHADVVAALSAAGLALPAGVSNLLTGSLTPKTGSTDGDAHDKLLDSLAAKTVTVKLIGMNDFHGNFEIPAAGNGGTVTVKDAANPAGTPVRVGGAAFLATLIKSLKAKNPLNAVVAAGDMVGASPFSSNITHDESTVDILNQLGLEFTSVGNHEFDRGKAELLRLQNGGCFPSDGKVGIVGQDTCLNNGQFTGAKFKWLSANVLTGPNGATLLPATAIKQFGLVSVGFIGLTLQGTPAVVTSTGVTGLTFADEADTINQRAAELKRKGVSAVAVLIHQGGQSTASTLNDQSCPGFTGDILPIMGKLSADVDLVISGHTHQEYICRINGKLLTSTGFYGGAVTEIDLTLSPAKGLVTSAANSVPVINDQTAGTVPAGFTKLTKDAAIDQVVQRYVSLTAPLKNAVVGSITADIKRALLPGVATPTRDETAEGAMGDVMADVYLAGGPQAELAFINPGGVRADLIFANGGAVTYGDLLTVAPFGNTLATADLTGAQIIRLLEQQWEVPNDTAKTGVNGGGRLLQPSSNLTYSWDASKPQGAAAGQGARVIVSTVRVNGQPIDLAKTYRVTFNSFMAPGPGDNFSVVTGGKNIVNSGIIDIDAMVSYFKAKSPVAPPAARVTRVN